MFSTPATRREKRDIERAERKQAALELRSPATSGGMNINFQGLSPTHVLPSPVGFVLSEETPRVCAADSSPTDDSDAVLKSPDSQVSPKAFFSDSDITPKQGNLKIVSTPVTLFSPLTTAAFITHHVANVETKPTPRDALATSAFLKIEHHRKHSFTPGSSNNAGLMSPPVANMQDTPSLQCSGLTTPTRS